MTFEQEVAVAAGLATVVTSFITLFVAVATFRSVKEMKKAREATYRPELMLAGSLVPVGAINGSTRAPLPTKWVHWDDWRKSSNEGREKFKYRATVFDIPLVNVGSGAAKNVTARWLFPIREFIETLNQGMQKHPLARKIGARFECKPLEPSDDEGYEIWFNSCEYCTHDFMSKEPRDVSEYILQASDHGQPRGLVLPEWFTLMCSAHMLYYLASSVDRFPPLRVLIQYTDIADKVHGVSYDIIFGRLAPPEEQPDIGRVYQAHLEIKRVHP